MAQNLITPKGSTFGVPDLHQLPQGKIVRKPLISGSQVTAIFFLIPALIIFLIFVVWPIIQSANYSLLNWDGVQAPTAAGLSNYVKLLSDPVFWKAIGNNVLVVIWSLLTQIPLAIGLAILLTGKIKGSAFFRTIYFAPLVLSDVLVASVWNWIYNAPIGMLNSFLKSIHLQPLGWLGDPNLSMLCILVVSTWRFLGFYIVIYIAAIQGISEELYEAARIDGGSGWQLHRFITIPLLLPTTRINAALIMIGSLKFFDLVWVMSQGGPSHSSEVLATFMFKEAFQIRDWGYASTIAMALFLLAFVIAVVFLVSTRQQAKVT
jgi:raffinose/stachyose/melibiose transport system permease protein